MAKLMIRLINAVGDVVNRDPDVAGRLKVVFLPNFSVKLGHGLYPAADLSEQISTAGKEASGTGNMKFSMNGALTIGTLDGANVEIREEVGAENFFLFGLTAEEVSRTLAEGYRPRDIYNGNAELKGVHRPDRRRPFLPRRPQPVPAAGRRPDLRTTTTCCWPTTPPTSPARKQVSAAYRDSRQWTRMSILNVARMGKFSSDRTIAEYCRDIWHVKRCQCRWCCSGKPQRRPGLASAIIRARCGGVAQLGERRVRNAEVVSSILILSTTRNLERA